MTDTTHHAQEIARAHRRLDQHEERIGALELSGAGMAEWRASTTEKLDAIQSGTQWLIRLVVGGLIAAVIGFIVSGGLNGTAQ